MRPAAEFWTLFSCTHDSGDGKPRVTRFGADLSKTLQLSLPYLGALWVVPSLLSILGSGGVVLDRSLPTGTSGQLGTPPPAFRI